MSKDAWKRKKAAHIAGIEKWIDAIDGALYLYDQYTRVPGAAIQLEREVFGVTRALTKQAIADWKSRGSKDSGNEFFAALASSVANHPDEEGTVAESGRQAYAQSSQLKGRRVEDIGFEKTE